MNSYLLKNGQIGSKELLRAVALMLIYSHESYQIDADGINARLPFSLDNVDLPPDVLIPITYSSKHQNVIENMDKPIIEFGDVVLSLVEPQTQNVKEFYDNYLKISSFCVNEKGDILDLYIGDSNSSKSDFNDPFKETFVFVAINKVKLTKVANNILGYPTKPMIQRLNKGVTTFIQKRA